MQGRGASWDLIVEKSISSKKRHREENDDGERQKGGGSMYEKKKSAKALEFSDDDIDFEALNVEVANEIIVHLEEGQFHRGQASVVRLVAKKTW